MSLVALAVVGIVVASVLSLSGDDDNDQLSSPQPTATASTGASPVTSVAPSGGSGSCAYEDAGEAAKKLPGKPPTSKVRTTGTQKAVLTLTQGVVKADLLTSKAPCTVNSFAFLAGQKYFDDTPCHRLTTSGIYVLQCGDPSGTGQGGPGYQFAEENLTGATYPAGTLAMARTQQPGTGGSQFFLVYKDTQLPPDYTPFGKITAGLDVLNGIAKTGQDDSNGQGDGKPKEPVKIESVTVTG